MAKDKKRTVGERTKQPSRGHFHDDTPEALAHRRRIEELEARNRSYRTLARMFLYGTLVIAIVMLVLQATSSVIDVGIGNPWDYLLARDRAKPKNFQQPESEVTTPSASSNLSKPSNQTAAVSDQQLNETPAVAPEPSLHPALQLAKTWDDFPLSQAFSPDGSRFVRIDPNQKVIQCLDLTSDPVTYFEVDMKTPISSAVFKRYKGKTWLVVAAPAQNFTELHIIDADDLRLYKTGLGKAPAKIPGAVTRLFAGKGNDPWIYISENRALSRFHISEQNIVPFHFDWFDTMLVSDSGDQVWIQQYTKGLHYRLDWPTKSNDPTEIKRTEASVPALSILRSVSEVASPDSLSGNAVVAFERELWDGSLSNRIVSTSYDTQFVFPNSGWIVGVDEQGFAFADQNDGKTFAQVPLPPNWFLNRQVRGQQPTLGSELAGARKSAKTHYDSERQLLWFAWSKHLIRLDMSKIELPSVDSMWPSNNVPTDWMATKRQQIDLGIADRTVKCEIVHGPEGMTIADQVIEWTPTMAQVGEHTFELVISRGSSEHVRKVTIAVDRPSLELPWKVYGLTTNDSGTFAIGIGKSVAIQNRPIRFQQLLVVDLREQRVVLDQTLPDPVVCVDLNNDTAFLGLYGRAMKASLPDLKAVDQVSDSTWNQHDVDALVAIADDELWASVSNRWIPIDQPTFDFAPGVQTGGARVFGRLEDGWLRDGVLFGVADKKPKFLLWPAEVRYTPLPGDIFPNSRFAPYIPIRVPSTRPFAADTPKIPIKADVKQLVAGQTPYSPHNLSLEQREQQLNLVLYDGSTFQQIASATIAHRPVVKKAIIHTSTETSPLKEPLLIANREAILVLLDRQLYQVKWSEFNIPNQPTFGISFKQSHWLLQLDQPTRVQYDCPGAVRFELKSYDLAEPDPADADATAIHKPNRAPPPKSQKQIKVESTNGEFELSLSRSVLRNLLLTQLRSVREHPKYRSSTLDEIVQGEQERLTPFLKLLTGQPPKGILFPVRVEVNAFSEDLRSSRIAHDYLVDLSIEDARKLIEPDSPKWQ